MDRTSAGLLAGWALVLLTPMLGVANLFAQWRSCRPDGQMSMAPADWVAGSEVRRSFSLGCDGSFVLGDGSTALVAGPFDWSLPLLAAFVAGVALVVACIRARRIPDATGTSAPA